MYLNVSQMYLRCISDVSQCISSVSPVQGSQGDLIDSCWVVLNMLIIAVVRLNLVLQNQLYTYI